MSEPEPTESSGHAYGSTWRFQGRQIRMAEWPWCKVRMALAEEWDEGEDPGTVAVFCDKTDLWSPHPPFHAYWGIAASSNPQWFSQLSHTSREMWSLEKQRSIACLVHWIPAGGTVHMQSLWWRSVLCRRKSHPEGCQCASTKRWQGKNHSLTGQFNSKTVHFPSLDLGWSISK